MCPLGGVAMSDVTNPPFLCWWHLCLLCRSLPQHHAETPKESPSLASLAGTYFTHEAKGADDAADADTAIINAEGGQNNSEEKKEYFI